MSKQTSKPFENFLSNSRLVRYLLLFAFGWAFIQFIAYFQTIIIVFVFAAIFAFLLNYPVQWLQKYTSHTVAVVVVFLTSLLLLIGLVATLGLAIVSELQQFVSQAPDLLDSFVNLVDQIETLLKNANIQVDLDFLQEDLKQEVSNLFSFVTAAVGKILSGLVEFIIILVVTFFMLLNGEELWASFQSFFPSNIEDLTLSLRNNFLGFFRGRLILSVFFGFSAFFVYLILQAPYPLFLATLVGVFDLIPGVGATIGIILSAIIVLPKGILISLQVIVYCVLLQQIEENILMPRIMQNSVNLNPVIIFFALLLGARIAGFLGLFLSIPIAAVIVGFVNIKNAGVKQIPGKNEQ
ncbi:MAG: AI-2E family transporter [Limnospira sp. PMC 737.11]|uniref:AI-2E family transporter n=1 Tax=unclassified Limnospira TaxID=2642885 RepID=UPI0028E0FD14|nr:MULTISPECIES: AI-2E family transporter [unclassified Limnospira]MDT9233834.1 AI-2E family transporter [Limnospira sp. PMC 917.15]MDT9274645.1 AI-2E family transporter [Limnospira sp. PMC 737.11]